MAREVDEPPAGQVSPAPDLMPPGEVIDRLLAESALFRLRAAQGQLGLADRQDPGHLLAMPVGARNSADDRDLRVRHRPQAA